jgi:hypothetical protein
MRLFGFRADALIASAVIVLGMTSDHARAAGSQNPSASCTSASPCLEEDNKGTGTGLTGTSLKGTGVIGTTAFKSNQSNATAGVFGKDVNTSDVYNAGVKGSSPGGFGVLGTSTNGPGVTGTSTKYIGVQGTGQFGVVGSGHIGVIANNTSDRTSEGLIIGGFGGNLIRANNSANADVFVVPDNGAVQALELEPSCFTSKQCPGDFGVLALSDRRAAVFAQGFSGASAVEAWGSGNFILLGVNTQLQNAFTVDDAGNLNITGQFQKNGGCLLGCTTVHGTSRRVGSYAAETSTPTIEDFGEGQIVSGDGYVALDRSFVNVIEQRPNYLVFITPEGDNRGLYVTNKTLKGFTVRESQGGRSTLAFSYRIVAKRYGENSPRLPMVELKTEQRPNLFVPGRSAHGKPDLRLPQTVGRR